jgi:hypothetical protein
MNPNPEAIIDLDPRIKLKQDIPKIEKVKWHSLNNEVIVKAAEENKIIILFVHDGSEENIIRNSVYGMRVYTFQALSEKINNNFLLIEVDLSDSSWRGHVELMQEGIYGFAIWVCLDAINQTIETNKLRKSAGKVPTWPVTMFFLPQTGYIHTEAFHGFMNARDFSGLLDQIRESARDAGHL